VQVRREKRTINREEIKMASGEAIFTNLHNYIKVSAANNHHHVYHHTAE